MTTSRRALNIEATRAALLAAARRAFAAHGYAGTELAVVAADAGVTTGAIYHHFAGKQGLFQAVAEQMEGEVLVGAAATPDTREMQTDPLSRLRQGFDALIEVCAEADVQRIIFVEAPQVLGPETWREIELRYALGAVRAVLAALSAEQVIRPYPVDLLARVLLALLREASGEVARTRGDVAAREAVGELVASVFDGLFGPATAGGAGSA